jgi:succinate dehydrogenase/fumarate reductase flavoprotein subunit
MLADLDTLPEHEAFDVVVVGAGAAGMAAALFAAIDGASVLLVERTAFVGGTTALSGGTTWVPGTRHAAAGDLLENVAGYLDRAIGERAPRALRQALLEQGARAIETLESSSDVAFRAYPRHPITSRRSKALPSRAARSRPLPFDGPRSAGCWLVRLPIPSSPCSAE